MTKQLAIYILASIIILLLLLSFSLVRSKIKSATIADPNKYCYLKKYGESPYEDIYYIEVLFNKDDTVVGVDNWLPAEKDINVAEFAGVVSGNILKVISTRMGEGEISTSEELYRFTNNSISRAQIDWNGLVFRDGVYRIPSNMEIKYGEEVPKVDCSDINQKEVSAEWYKELYKK